MREDPIVTSTVLGINLEVKKPITQLQKAKKLWGLIEDYDEDLDQELLKYGEDYAKWR